MLTIRTHNRLRRLDRTIARLKQRSHQLEQISKRYWRARQVLFVLGVLITLMTLQFAGGRPGLFVAALFVASFSGVTIYHNRVRESIKRVGLMLEIKTVQIARINLDWEHLPATDYLPAVPQHPFETDIDLTGDRSLQRLLDTAVTTEGSRRLRSWLLDNAPDREVIERRQTLVHELENLSLFRDKLNLYTSLESREAKYFGRKRSTHSERWDSRTLVSWIEHSLPQDSLRRTVVMLAVLASVNIVLFTLAVLNVVPHVWPIVFLIYVGTMIFKQGRIANAWGEVQDLEKALRRFGIVFRYLEARGCSGLPRLAEVCAPFLDSRKRPSAELRKVERIAAELGLRTNALLWLIVQALVPWDFFFTYRLEKLKEEIGEQLPRWLDAWYELEALNSLANFAWLNPNYTFPKIDLQRKHFFARGLGHPLIRPEQRVCNDFLLDDDHQMVILTGSNMAGKSTFLRTVGLNLRLAFAGAPVSAESVELSLLRLFTCINVSDSVQDGLSYFYAEVKRLKLLLTAVEESDELPIMFLIDEIFRGTNNLERHIGSRAFIRTLSMRRNAVGVIATHDLELTKLAAEIPGVENFHFREDVSNGRMVFDYRLRPGPCPTTNALTIMRIEGLPVN